jgi:hypothetical protein
MSSSASPAAGCPPRAVPMLQPSHCAPLWILRRTVFVGGEYPRSFSFHTAICPGNEEVSRYSQMSAWHFQEHVIIRATVYTVI